MDIATIFSSGLFDAFGQPVLYVKDGAVTQCNAAAQVLGIRAGTSLDDCLDGAELPDTLPAALPLRLAGRDCTVTVRAAEDGLLLVAEPKDERLPPDTLLSIAGALSSALTNLTGSAAALLPVLEELEARSVSAVSNSRRPAMWMRASAAVSGRQTELCSKPEITTSSPGRMSVCTARLSACVAFIVNTTCSGFASNSAAASVRQR